MSVKRNFSITVGKTSLLLMLAFASYILWQLIGLTYSENMKNGVNILFSRLSMIVVPLLFVFPGRKVHDNRKVLLKSFAWSTALFILFRFIVAFIHSASFQNGQLVINTHPPVEYWMSYFYGPYLAGDQHPSYLAMFVILSTFISLESASEIHITKYWRMLWTVSACVLLASLYFLSSRSGFMVILILLPVFLFVKIWQRRKLVFTLLSLFLIILVVSSIVLTNERIKTNIEQIADGSFRGKLADDGRLLIWESAFKIAERNIIFGVGVGDVRDELLKEYKLQEEKDLINSRYNAHNQFIEVLLEGGVIGLLIFLALISIMVHETLVHRNLLLGLFVLEMIIFFLFETVLYRLAGVTFFTIFSFLLLNVNRSE